MEPDGCPRGYLWAPCMVTLAAPWVSDRGGYERPSMGAAWVSAYTLAVASAAGGLLEDQSRARMLPPPRSVLVTHSLAISPLPMPLFCPIVLSLSLSLALAPPPSHPISVSLSIPPLPAYPRPPLARALQNYLSLAASPMSPVGLSAPAEQLWPRHCFRGPHTPIAVLDTTI